MVFLGFDAAVIPTERGSLRGIEVINMGDTRIKIADFARQLFPHYRDTVEALKSLVAVANEIIEDITDLDRMMSIPPGTEDPCMHYETYSQVEYDDDPR
jgi:hypothetical protein